MCEVIVRSLQRLSVRRLGLALGVVLLAGSATVGAASWALAAPAGHLKLTPAAGPVGSRVTFAGYLSRSVVRTNPHLAATDLFLEGETVRCGLLVYLRSAEVHLNRGTGHVTGAFSIGRRGSCPQSNGTPHRVTPGQYALSVGCLACEVATFSITPEAESLPFTGAAPWPLAAAGAAALAVGLFLWLLADPLTVPLRPASRRR